MTINILKFQKSLNIKFNSKTLLINALTHKSANQKFNYEKLEFLGDRVIGLVLSNKLFNLYPHESEGVLDKKFANLVNRKTCRDIAWSLNIQNYIILGNTKKKITKDDQKILSDACEALIGAIFIDRGYEYVKEFILKIWKNKIDKSAVTVLDAKTKLQEHSLKSFKKLPYYKVIGSKGPKHSPVYRISVSIHGSKEFVGTGSSKQHAEQDGAAKLLKNININ